MMNLVPDVIACIYMFTIEEGGLKRKIISSQYRCPLFIDGEGFDCCLLLDNIKDGLSPGKTFEVPIKFLRFDLAQHHLLPGAQFVLWAGRNIANGKILEVCRKE
jgi:hypothetical protein